MAKQETLQYWQTVAKKAGASEDQTKALETLLANDEFGNAFIPRPEYSRTLDEKDSAYKKLQGEVSDYYKTELARTDQNKKVVEETQARLQAYMNTYGELPTDGRTIQSPTVDTSKFVSVEDHKKQLDAIGQQALFVTKEGIKAASDYMYRFGKPLDVDGLEKFAVERGLPINMAYQEYIKPEVQAKESASWEEKLKAAKEEGAREALSRVKVPIDTTPKETSPFAANLEAMQAKQATAPTQQRINSFAEAWNGVNATKG